jgi:predicted porin
MNKKLLTIAVAGAMATPMAAQAVKYKLSGQVNRAIVFMDDGVQSDVRNVDNIESGTRWRLRGSEDLGNGMKVGFYYEMQTSSAPSSAAFPDQNTDGNNGVSGGGNIRQANVWFSGNWGKLSMGQLDGAANGATESDLSGTCISGNCVLRGSFTGGIAWRTSTGSTGATLGGLTSGGTHSNFDGFSRYDGIRYDSPALGPVTLSGSVGNDNKWDVAARVDTALGGGQLSGALFYGENDQGGTFGTGIDNQWGGSLSFLFSQGTSITGSYAQLEPEATGAADADNWYIKLGHKWGPHAVGIGYGETSDLGGRGFEDSGFDIGYVHTLKKANTELYASFVNHSLDTPAGFVSAEDINVFVIGARVKFD